MNSLEPILIFLIRAICLAFAACLIIKGAIWLLPKISCAMRSLTEKL